jgi:hypothetical protein
VDFDPEEQNGALRIVGMKHADDDRAIHLTGAERS